MTAKTVLRILAIVVGISAAWMISGCSHTPAPVTTSTDSSITIPVAEDYPQMFTEDMREILPGVEKAHDVTFLGCYDDLDGAFLFWVWNNKTSECQAHIIWPDNAMDTMECDEGYEVYRAACLDSGNCL